MPSLHKPKHRIARQRVFISLSLTEIGDLDVAVAIEEQIFELEIAIHNVVVVEVAERQRDLGSIKATSLFAEARLSQLHILKSACLASARHLDDGRLT